MSLEIKKLKRDLLRAQAAKAELECKIEERKEEMKRIEEHILLQEEVIKEKEEKLAELGEYLI